MSTNDEKLPYLLKHWLTMYRPLVQFFFRSTGCPATSEDLAQDLADRLQRCDLVGRHPAIARAYIWRTARSIRADWFRKRNRTIPTVAIDDRIRESTKDEGPSPHDTLEHEQLIDTLLSELTPAERRVIERQRDGLTCAEIAAEQNISVNTVKDHLKEARRKLNALFPKGDTHGRF